MLISTQYMPFDLYAVAIGSSLRLKIVARPFFFENKTSQPMSVNLLTDSKLVPRAGTYKTFKSCTLRCFPVTDSRIVPIPVAGTVLSSPIRTCIGFRSRCIFRKALLSLQKWSDAPESRCHAFRKEMSLYWFLTIGVLVQQVQISASAIVASSVVSAVVAAIAAFADASFLEDFFEVSFRC